MVASMDVLSARRWMDIKTRCQQLFAAKIDVGGTARSYAELQEPYRIEVNFRNIHRRRDAAKGHGITDFVQAHVPNSWHSSTKSFRSCWRKTRSMIRLKAELAK